MANDNRIYLESDSNIVARGLQDSLSRDYVNDATATYTLKDSDGAVVSGLADVSMSYQVGSRGTYVGVIHQDTDLTEGAIYEITVVISASGRDLTYKTTAKAIYAGSEA